MNQASNFFFCFVCALLTATLIGVITQNFDYFFINMLGCFVGWYSVDLINWIIKRSKR